MKGAQAWAMVHVGRFHRSQARTRFATRTDAAPALAGLLPTPQVPTCRAMARFRRLRYERPDPGPAVPAHDPICALCGRPIPADAPRSLHHLVPKMKGGTHGPTVLLHHLCHKEIHATLSEAELARDFSTPEALRAHPRLARFIEWVRKRPPHFLSRVPKRRTLR